MDKSFAHVVFDWNGTLIDDVDLAVEAVNAVLSAAGLRRITRRIYRARFRFPIQDFYRALGFTFADVPFARVIGDYLAVFDTRVHECPLHAGALELIEAARDAAISVSILSASHHAILGRTLRHHRLEHHFAHVMGLDHEHAPGKREQAVMLGRRIGVEPERVLYIGDTTHDADIARELGWAGLLVANGHQSAAVLSRAGCLMADDLPTIRARVIGAVETEASRRPARGCSGGERRQ